MAGSGRLGMFLLLTAFTGLGLLYDVTVPLFEKPDELKHFAVIQYIQTRRQLPVVRAGVYEPWDQEGTQPPLYHLLAAVATAWLDLSDFAEPPRNPHYADERSFEWRERGNNNLYLHAPGELWDTDPIFVAARLARWLSLLAGLATITLTYFLARLTFSANDLSSPPPPPNHLTNQPTNQPTIHPSIPLPLLAAALIAFIPQFLHVSSAITNDGLSATIAAASLLLLALIVKKGGSNRYAILLGLILGLAALAKLSLLYLIPLTGLVLLFDGWRQRSIGRLVSQGAITGGLMLLVAGWWYWRNWQLYGDPTALTAHLLYRGGPLDPRPTLAQIWQTELTGLELSFWAAFGAGQILLEPWIYTVLRGVKYLLLVGVIIGVWRVIRLQVAGRRLQVAGSKSQVAGGKSWEAEGKSQVAGSRIQVTRSGEQAKDNSKLKTQNSKLLILGLLALWTLIIFFALLRWMQITPASWGRLLYPALPSLGVLAAWGLSQFSTGDWRLGIRDWRFTRHAPHFTLPALRTTHHPSRITLHALRATRHVVPWLLLVLLFKLAVISPFRYLEAAYGKTPLVSETDVPLDQIEPVDFVYDNALRLIGYTVGATAVQPGERLPVTLYWQAIRPIDRNYSAFVHLLGRDNEVIGQVNTYPDGGNWPTSLLPPGQVLKDTYHVPVSPEAGAPAVIRLAVGIFDFEDPARRAKPAVDAAGQPVEPIVGGIPLLPHTWPDLTPSRPLTANFGGQIRLVGYDWPAGDSIKPGETVPLTLYWETLASPGQNLNLFIHLVDPAAQSQVAGFDAPPGFPTSFWQPGYTLIDARRLALPADLPPGDYELWIGWYDLETLARLPLADGTGDALRLATVSLRHPEF